MAWGIGAPCPKPAPRVKDRIASRASRERKAAAFRSAVWQRDGGQCRICGRKVTRTLTLCAEQGHVHHLRGRNVAPEDRYDPKKALLLCAVCHADAHAGKVKVR